MTKLAGELMKTECTNVPEDVAIYEAVKKIAAREKGKIACVVDREGKLKGLLTQGTFWRHSKYGNSAVSKNATLSVPSLTFPNIEIRQGHNERPRKRSCQR